MIWNCLSLSFFYFSKKDEARLKREDPMAWYENVSNLVEIFFCLAHLSLCFCVFVNVIIIYYYYFKIYIRAWKKKPIRQHKNIVFERKKEEENLKWKT